MQNLEKFRIGILNLFILSRYEYTDINFLTMVGGEPVRLTPSL